MMPGGTGQIHTAFKHERLAGDFCKTAVATFGPALRAYVAIETGNLIGPDDDFSAVTAEGGIGRDGDIVTDESAQRVTDIRVAALEVAANEDLASTVTAGGVNGGVEEPDLFAEEFQDATDAFFIGGIDDTADDSGAGGFDGGRSPTLHFDGTRAGDVCALDVDLAGVVGGKGTVVLHLAATGDEDLAAFADLDGRSDVTGIGECLTEHVARAEDDFAAADFAFVFDGGAVFRIGVVGVLQIIEGLAVDLDVDLAVGIADERAFAGEQHDEAVFRDKRAGVDDLAADEADGFGADAALVDDVAIAAEKPVVAQKTLVGDIHSSRDETIDIDSSSAAEVEPGRVDQHDASVGGQRAADLGAAGAEHTVEHPGRGVRL